MDAFVAAPLARRAARHVDTGMIGSVQSG